MAALFEVFLEVVTGCVCCLEAHELRYFWPQRFKNILGGQTLNCVMMSRDKSAIVCSIFAQGDDHHHRGMFGSRVEVTWRSRPRNDSGVTTPPPAPPPHDPSAFPLRTCYYSGMQAGGGYWKDRVAPGRPFIRARETAMETK